MSKCHQRGYLALSRVMQVRLRILNGRAVPEKTAAKQVVKEDLAELKLGPAQACRRASVQRLGPRRNHRQQVVVVLVRAVEIEPKPVTTRGVNKTARAGPSGVGRQVTRDRGIAMG